LTNAADTVIAEGISLELRGSIVNTGSITSEGASATLRAGSSTVTLSGGGKVELTGTGTNTINGIVGANRLVNEDNLIRIDGNITGLMTNNATIEAVGGGLSIGTASMINNGVIRTTPGAPLVVNAAVSGTGSWDIDASKMTVSAGRSVTTQGTITIRDGAELEMVGNVGSVMSGSDLTIARLGAIEIGSTSAPMDVRLTGSLSFAMTDETLWNWNAASDLHMLGGVGAQLGDWATWASLEIGGHDFGITPATHSGAAAGFTANFNLAELIIGANAHVFLADSLDNGNRGANFFDSGLEALYVGRLTFLDGAGQLNLNGLNLYYTTLTGSTSQIVNELVPASEVPEPGTAAVLGLGAAALLARRRRRKG